MNYLKTYESKGEGKIFHLTEDIPDDTLKKMFENVEVMKNINESYIKKFESFRLEEPSTMSELLEKLSVVEQSILDSINAEPINMDEFFNGSLPTNDLHQLSDNADFNNLLRMKGLKKKGVENTEDFETFLLSQFKYLLIWDKDKIEIMDPDYIMIQTFNSTEQDWNNIKMYKVNGDFMNFYDKLSNRTIELEHDGVNYLYQTSNKNEWELTNQKGTNRFPRFVRKEDLLKIINKL